MLLRDATLPLLTVGPKNLDWSGASEKGRRNLIAAGAEGCLSLGTLQGRKPR